MMENSFEKVLGQNQIHAIGIYGCKRYEQRLSRFFSLSSLLSLIYYIVYNIYIEREQRE